MRIGTRNNWGYLCRPSLCVRGGGWGLIRTSSLYFPWRRDVDLCRSLFPSFLLYRDEDGNRRSFLSRQWRRKSDSVAKILSRGRSWMLHPFSKVICRNVFSSLEKSWITDFLNDFSVQKVLKKGWTPLKTHAVIPDCKKSVPMIITSTINIEN